MSISDKTRKILWAKSGNRCAICKCLLIRRSSPEDHFSIVGDECHIVSGKANGPRYKQSIDESKIDDIDNLILLCKNHHKNIDDCEKEYSVERLKQIKANHENWVEKKPDPYRLTSEEYGGKNTTPAYLVRLTTGKELWNIIYGAEAYEFDYDNPSSSEEMELLSCFLQNVQDFGDISTEIEAGGQIEFAFNFSKEIKLLEEGGFFVFGSKYYKNVKYENKSIQFRTVVIRVLRTSNSQILGI